MMTGNTSRISLVILAMLSLFLFFSWEKTHYRISDYFPLNENDTYFYTYHQGPEPSMVTIKVKNVKDVKEGKQCEFIWKGNYSDRIQVNLLNRSGIMSLENRHLAGEVPHKVIRKHEPALVMLPALLTKHYLSQSSECVYDYDGHLIEKDTIEAHVSFLGKETVSVDAGKFECLSFLASHIYRESSGRLTQMHLYNFWIAKGIGIVKHIHTFVPFIYVRYFKEKDLNLMNRYSGGFSERFELKKAVINGKVIGSE